MLRAHVDHDRLVAPFGLLGSDLRPVTALGEVDPVGLGLFSGKDVVAHQLYVLR